MFRTYSKIETLFSAEFLRSIKNIFINTKNEKAENSQDTFLLCVLNK